MNHGSVASSAAGQRKASCGCVEGFVGLLIGVGFFAWNYAHTPGSAPGLRGALTAIGFGLAGAVVGKIVGLTWPRLRSRGRGG
jgi:hypothetical protein